MEHTQQPSPSNEPMDEQQAQQLLGTLSRNRDDIQAAYRHRYRNCALKLSRVATHTEQQQLESQLSQLNHAQSLLLEENTEVVGDIPALQPTKQQSLRQQPLKQRPGILLSITLALLVILLSASGSQLWNQSQQLQHLQRQLVEGQDQRQQLQQQHQKQYQTLQQTLASSLQQQSEERLHWLTVNQQQHDQLQRQLSLIEQQQQVTQQLQQSLARVDKQLYVERNQTLELQQQIARLNQQSGVLIDELCSDSATTSPAMNDEMLPAYMNRCRLLWSLAGD